jgi:hypothetical protein
MQFKIQKQNLIHFTGSRIGIVNICLMGGIGVMFISTLKITHIIIIIIVKCSIFLKNNNRRASLRLSESI